MDILGTYFDGLNFEFLRRAICISQVSELRITVDGITIGHIHSFKGYLTWFVSSARSATSSTFAFTLIYPCDDNLHQPEFVHDVHRC